MRRTPPSTPTDPASGNSSEAQERAVEAQPAIGVDEDEPGIHRQKDEIPNPLSALWAVDTAEYVFPDMVRVVLPGPHDEVIGKYVKTISDLETGEVISTKVTHRSVHGWWGTAAVRTGAPPSKHSLEMRFCPGKYFFGQNAFGPNNLPKLVQYAFTDNVNRFNLHPEDSNWAGVFDGDAELHELDITAMIDVGGKDVVRALLDCGESGGRHDKWGPPKRYSDTLVFGEGKYYSLKLYDKWSEMPQTDAKADYRSDLWESARQWAEGKMRVELHLTRRKLQALHLTKVRDWTPETMARELRKQLDKISIPPTRQPVSAIMDNLDDAEKRVVSAALGGCSLEQQFQSPATRRKYRRNLSMKGINIDRMGSLEAGDTSTVSVNWDDIKSKRFESPPDWALEVRDPFPSSTAVIEESHRPLSR